MLYPGCAPWESETFLPALRVPESSLPILSNACKRGAACIPGNFTCAKGMSIKHMQHLPGFPSKDGDWTTYRGCSQPFPIGRPGQRVHMVIQLRQPLLERLGIEDPFRGGFYARHARNPSLSLALSRFRPIKMSEVRRGLFSQGR